MCVKLSPPSHNINGYLVWNEEANTSQPSMPCIVGKDPDGTSDGHVFTCETWYSLHQANSPAPRRIWLVTPDRCVVGCLNFACFTYVCVFVCTGLVTFNSSCTWMVLIMSLIKCHVVIKFQCITVISTLAFNQVNTSSWNSYICSWWESWSYIHICIPWKESVQLQQPSKALYVIIICNHYGHIANTGNTV